MRFARLGVTIAALAAAGGLVLVSTGAAQAGTLTQQAPAAAPAARPAQSTVSTPITGSFPDALGGTGTFAGTFTPTQFVNQNGQLAAIGTVTGTLTDSLGAVVGTATQQATVPLAVSGTCDVLHLDLGPLDLNLLGLVVHLDEVVLDITAQQGAGNLLGNLLCAVTGLLDNPGNGALNGIVALLNRILGALG
jgi:hypothetical protein